MEKKTVELKITNMLCKKRWAFYGMTQNDSVRITNILDSSLKLFCDIKSVKVSME